MQALSRSQMQLAVTLGECLIVGFQGSADLLTDGLAINTVQSITLRECLKKVSPLSQYMKIDRSHILSQYVGSVGTA